MILCQNSIVDDNFISKVANEIIKKRLVQNSSNTYIKEVKTRINTHINSRVDTIITYKNKLNSYSYYITKEKTILLAFEIINPNSKFIENTFITMSKDEFIKILSFNVPDSGEYSILSSDSDATITFVFKNKILKELRYFGVNID